LFGDVHSGADDVGDLATGVGERGVAPGDGASAAVRTSGTSPGAWTTSKKGCPSTSAARRPVTSSHWLLKTVIRPTASSTTMRMPAVSSTAWVKSRSWRKAVLSADSSAAVRVSRVAVRPVCRTRRLVSQAHMPPAMTNSTASRKSASRTCVGSGAGTGNAAPSDPMPGNNTSAAAEIMPASVSFGP
jgi:hypothetical protein